MPMRQCLQRCLVRKFCYHGDGCNRVYVECFRKQPEGSRAKLELKVNQPGRFALFLF